MMKITLLAMFFMFLLFAFTTTTTTTATLVYDSDGKPLRNGDEYYLSPSEPYGDAVTVIKSAAIWRGKTTSESCSLAVAKSYANRWPTVISTPLNILHISTHNPLLISFSHLPHNLCTNSSNWVVINSSKSVGYPLMVGNRNTQEFSNAVVKGWFFIKPYESGSEYYYKLVFCHKENECADVGVHSDNQQHKLLIVTDDKPVMVFRFHKVRESLISMVV